MTNQPPETTPNGYEHDFVKSVAEALRDRGESYTVTDFTDLLWERYIGPMLDQIELDCEVVPFDGRSPVLVVIEEDEPTDDQIYNRFGVEGGIAYDTVDRRTEDDV